MNMFYERRFAAIEERAAVMQRLLDEQSQAIAEQAQLLAEIRSLATFNNAPAAVAVQPKPTRKKP